MHAPKTPLPPPTNRERTKKWLHKQPIAQQWEKRHPLLLGLTAATLVAHSRINPQQLKDLSKDVLPQALAVAAILAGFQGTMQTILLAMREWKVVRRLEQGGLYKLLIHYVWSGLMSLLLFVAVALLVPMLGTLELLPAYPCEVATILVGLFVFALLASMRIMLLVIKMLREPADTAPVLDRR